MYMVKAERFVRVGQHIPIRTSHCASRSVSNITNKISGVPNLRRGKVYVTWTEDRSECALSDVISCILWTCVIPGGWLSARREAATIAVFESLTGP